MSSFFVLLHLTLCITLHPHLIVAQQNFGSSLITKACERSAHQDFCLNVLNADPNSQTADLKGLAFNALRYTSTNVTDTSVFIKQSLSNTADLDPIVEQALSDCNDVYLSTVDLIDDSINALVSNAYPDVDKWVKAAVANIDTCEASVTNKTGSALEVSHKNRILRQLCNTALSVVHVLANN